MTLCCCDIRRLLWAEQTIDQESEMTLSFLFKILDCPFRAEEPFINCMCSANHASLIWVHFTCGDISLCDHIMVHPFCATTSEEPIQVIRGRYSLSSEEKG